MKKIVRRKKITIPFRGLIGPLGVSGPVDHPYMESIERLGKIVMSGYPVTEILKDGTQVKLDASNYDRENGNPDDPSIVASWENDKVRRKADRATIVLDDEAIKQRSMEHTLQQSTKKMSSAVSRDLESPKTAEIPANKSRVEGKEHRKDKKHKVDDFVEVK